MKRHEISQLPVMDGNRLAGVVSELELLKALVSGADGNTPVDDFITSNFAILEPNNSTALLAELLAQDRTVIVQDAGSIVGVLTKIDLIDDMSERMRETH
jgi:cystathionine beta-synthase